MKFAAKSKNFIQIRLKFFFFQNLDFVLGSLDQMRADLLTSFGGQQFFIKANDTSFQRMLKKKIATKIFDYSARSDFR